MKFYHALWHKYHAEISRCQDELEVAIAAPVGVGDHICALSRDIDRLITSLSEAEGKLDTLNRVFVGHRNPLEVERERTIMELAATEDSGLEGRSND